MKNQPRYSKEEFGRRGDTIYESESPILENGNEGKFVAIDIETGAYQVDGNELAASDRLLARVPNAQIWLRRIGFDTRATLRPTHDHPNMIAGVVTNDRQAVIHLTVRGPAGQEQEIEAIIDTGFDGG